MFELRWVVDPRSDAHRVLQYRRVEKIVRDIRRAKWWARPQMVETAVWGEWKDVPEVTEGVQNCTA